MKLLVTSQGSTLESEIDSRFGRAKYFIVYDTDNDSFEVKNNNQNLNSAQGAGIQAAQNAVDAGAEIIITGHCGPKAFRVLSEGNIKIAVNAAGTVADAVRNYKEGNLNFADSPDVEGHWV